MRLQVKGRKRRGQRFDPEVRREDKLGKLERQLADPTQVELELAVETNSIAESHGRIAEATIWTK